MVKVINIGLLLFFVFSFSSCTFSGEDKSKESESEGATYFVVGEKEAGEQFNEAFQQVDPAYDRILAANKYYEEGNYQKALSEALAAMNTSDSIVVHRLAHHALVNIYEKTGQYDSAIKEINWLLDGHVNENGRKKLLERKAKLEKLINN